MMNPIKVASNSRLIQSAGMLLALLGGLGCTAHAQLLIDVGDHSFPAATSQTIEFTLENTGASAISYSGLNFNMELPSGGATITGVDLITGTIFQSNNDGQEIPPGNTATFWSVNITTAGNPPSIVTLDAGQTTMLATVTLTTGGIGGPFALNLGDTIGGTTEFLNASGLLIPETVTINDGTLTVVPEPNASLAVAGLLLGAAAFARRWRAAR
jgi:hypothetical protein